MKLRELPVGWLYTISGLDEKSFPLGFKEVSLKELAVIFPLLLLAIAFIFKNIMLSMAFLSPVLFFIFFEEKSMDEFSYIYHFMKFYLGDLLARREEIKENEKKEIKKKKRSFEMRISKDEIIIISLAIIATANLNPVIDLFEMKPSYPDLLLRVFVFAVATGISIGLLLSKIILKIIYRKLESKK